MEREILIVNNTESANSGKLYDLLASKYSVGLVELTSQVKPIESILVHSQRLTVYLSDKKNLYSTIGLSCLDPANRVLIIYEKALNNDFYNILSRNFNHILKFPINLKEIMQIVDKYLGKSNDEEKNRVKKNLLKTLSLSGIIGEDSNFINMISRIPQVAERQIPVMLYGETGVGKEVCARAIHYLSNRSDKPFIPVDCGSIPTNLFENELFGHKKGAFTDARNSYSGLVEEANGGTLFLDEIGVLSYRTQSKLLRLIQESTYRPLGSNKDCKADIRIIAATNTDLKEKINTKSFRADLYYRFGMTIHIPPLRDRKKDIPLLADHFIKKHASNNTERSKKISPPTIKKLLSYDWPGNVRELENVIRQALILSEGSVISPGDIHLSGSLYPDNQFIDMGFSEAKKKAIENFEKNYIKQAMHIAEGNITKAAEIAQKDRADFSRLVKKYNLKI
jgi:two-component system response regulator GlrR